MENEILLNLEEVNQSIQAWKIACESYVTVKPYLSSGKIFFLSRANYETHLEQEEGEYIHAYFGIYEGALSLIWVPTNYSPETSFVCSRFTAPQEPSFLVDTLTKVETNVVELSVDLDFKDSYSFEERNYIGSENAIPSAMASRRIYDWNANYLDWTWMTFQYNRGMVRAFSIPTDDPATLFEDESVTGVKALMGLYLSTIAGYVIPDLILIGDRTRPTGIIKNPKAIGFNEATDLIRPCPPFCNERNFTLL